MAEKITNINVEGRVYEFLSGQGVKGACTAPASSWTKPIVLPEGAVLLDGLIMAITFVNGNSVGFSGTKTIYSSDGENFYYDQAKTDSVTFPPVDNYTLEHTSGEEYSFSAFPTIVYGDHTLPVRDAKGHITGGDIWNTGDTVICIFIDNMFLMLSAAVANAVTSGDMNPVTSDAVYQALQSAGGAQCHTAGNVQDKVATMNGFVLNSGVTFPITFAASNSYDGKITLNINSTGAKDIYINGSVSSSTNKTLNAGSYICRYNGTNYYIDTSYAVTQARNASFASMTDYSRQGAYCTTASGTQAKVAGMRGFVLQSGDTFPITFTNANSYNGKITLSVNNTTAKDIYINGSVSSSSNKTLPAGTYLCHYNGSAYYIDTGYAAATARASSYAVKVRGNYTGSGGQQNPQYVGKNRVCFNMMNTSVLSDTTYKDWMMMDCYSGHDVGGTTAFGISRTQLRAYIMRANAGTSPDRPTSWAESGEVPIITAKSWNATSGYIVFSNGLKMQWGKQNANGANSQGPWYYALTTSFTQPPIVICQRGALPSSDNIDGAGRASNTWKVTKTSFYFDPNFGYTGKNYFWYFAIGY